MSSAAKMVADSTQSDTDSRKNRNRSSGRKEKKSRKERKRKRHSSSSSRSRSRSRSSSPDSRRTKSATPTHSGSEEYDSDIDLQKELKPLSAYLKNPPDLLDHMLHSVRGSSLQRALPDILKTMPMEELRRRCLEHLEVLSRKRMMRILAGADPQTISSSGTDDDSTDEDMEKEAEVENKADSTGEEGKDREPVVVKIEPPADSPLSLAAEDLDDAHGPPPYHQAPDVDEEAMEEEEDGDDGEVAQEEEEEEEEEEDGDWGLAEGAEDMSPRMCLFPDMEQDRMDLLELEMRARAIKAMLALHEQREKSQKRVPAMAKPTTKKK